MDVIVTDHHEPGEVLPVADIIIHPGLKDTTYPFPYLAGVGVAFKVAHALLGEIPKELLLLSRNWNSCRFGVINTMKIVILCNKV